MVSKLIFCIKAFRKKTAGIAAIEFAMIVPLMIALYMGSVEMGQALDIDRKVTSVASATADLVSQSKEITKSEVDDIFRISKGILEPYDDSSIKIIVSSVTADEDNDQRVDWSASNENGTPRSEGSKIPGMPENITEPNSSVIVAEVEYVYKSPVSYYITGPITLSDVFYLRPRQSLSVNYDDPNTFDGSGGSEE